MALEPLTFQHLVLVFCITLPTPLQVSLGFSWSRMFQVCLLYLDTGVFLSASLTSRACKAMWPQPQKMSSCACSWLETSSESPARCTGSGWALRVNTPHKYWNGMEELFYEVWPLEDAEAFRGLFFSLYFDFKKAIYLLVTSASAEKDLRKLL